MPISTLKDSANKGEARKRVNADGHANPPELRNKRSSGPSGARVKPTADEDQRRSERSQRAMDNGPRSTVELDDYDEDKP